MSEHPAIHSCSCCTTPCQKAKASSAIDRRDFMTGVSAMTVGGLTLAALHARAQQSKEPDHFQPVAIPLRVQPVLAYSLPQRHEATSWRGWGAIQTAEDVAEENERIGKELSTLKKQAEFPLEIKPLIGVETKEQADNAIKGDHDILLLYAAGHGTEMMEALSDPKKWTIMFVRHKSGPVYLWYEIAHNRYLRKTVDTYGQPGMTPKDVVVDSHDEVLWRLRSLYALKNTLNKRIVTIGGPSGWGDGGQVAPQKSRDIWKWDIVDCPYKDLEKMIQKARDNDALVKRCFNQADDYLKQDGISLDTTREFVRNAFVLNEVFKNVLDEFQTDAITINSCMGTIMPMSETTACLPLSLLNDEGYMAFCESDFVVIPSGVLLHYISGKPVFLNDPTYPHDGVVTMAHCTAPRKNDGENYDPAKILTHFESDYGAAPKVDMKLGQTLTVIDPDFESKRWMGFEATVIDNPFLPICRSQVDIEMKADTDTVNEETRGFHWMACYGNHLKETGYALQKAGVDWLNLTKA